MDPLERPRLVDVVDRLRAKGLDPESNRYALELTLEAMPVGRVGPDRAALVQMCRSLAAMCDYDPLSAPLWARYQKALEELCADGDSGDAFGLLMAEIGRSSRGGAAVRDTA